MQDPAPLSTSTPPPPAATGGWGRWADAVAVGLVVAFGFVAASFVARNSDVWLHLAAGRLVAAGEYRFGTDPFSYTSTGEYWANHAWLFDLGLYLAYGWIGGTGLVVLKATAVAVTVGLMLAIARGRGPAWVATVCVLVAVLAAAPRLLLQPPVASLLLLAGCLCCLRAGGRAFSAVPVLIALWVNVDGWFVLGPTLVGLVWLGRWLDPDRARLPPWPAWLFPAALGACLVSPHHVFALRLPAELSPGVWASGFRSDPRFAGAFASPWRLAQLGPAGGYSPSAWAFFALFALGLGSFAANRAAVRSWRFAVWVPFALLAVWQARLIPFFAVVAGPIAALNLREVVPSAALPRVGRGMVLAAAVAVLALGCVGWATGIHTRDRGIAWGVYADPTLVQAAEGVRRWHHAGGATSETRVFPTHPDVGHYLAWFAPGERYFLDSRLALFAGVAGDFLTLSPTLNLVPDDTSRDLLLRYEVGAVLLYDPDGGRMTRALTALAHNSWEVARIDGTAVLLVPPGAAGGRFDPERAAFDGATDLPTAGAGPGHLAEPVPWWHRLPERGRSGSWEADSATVYLRLAENGQSQSPALPLLAVRAGRCGAEADPRDPTAWLMLGRAYLFLGAATWEHEAGSGLTPLEHVRVLQATAALVQAALLNPDSLPAHESLARLFLRRNMLDLAHRHTVVAARLFRHAAPGVTTGPSADRGAQLTALEDTLERAVQEAQNRFIIRTAGAAGDPLAQARVAAELGLTQKALDILLASHSDLYGPAGVGLLADLLLQTGQIAECRTLLDRTELRGNPNVLGVYNLPRQPNPDGTRWPYRVPAYDWLDLCQCAAAGRYTHAQAVIDKLCGRLDASERRTAPTLAIGASALLASETGLAVPLNPLLGRLYCAQERIALNGLLGQTLSLSVDRADLWTLAGVLELERGDLQAAAGRFESARAVYAAHAGPLSRPGEPLAAKYHEALRRRP
jgi:tetratricopeptide (TPR) repeat protein